MPRFPPARYSSKVSDVKMAAMAAGSRARPANRVFNKIKPAPQRMKQTAVLYCMGAASVKIWKKPVQCAYQAMMMLQPAAAETRPAMMTQTPGQRAGGNGAFVIGPGIGVDPDSKVGNREACSFLCLTSYAAASMSGGYET